MKGKWISIDGCEGCGKTTLVSILKDKYPECIYVPEFSDSFVGNTLCNAVNKEPYFISKSIISASLLFLSDYFQLVDSVIMPGIKNGNTVVSDRGFASKIAVQAAVMLQSYEEQHVRRVLESLFSLCITPDLTIIMDTPLDIVKSRLLSRGGKVDKDREKIILMSKKEIYRYVKKFDLENIIIHTTKDVDEFVSDFLKYI